MATILTTERRNALGSLITNWIGEQDPDGDVLVAFDYFDVAKIDALIDEAIAPTIADAVQCALAEQAKGVQADLLQALLELRGEIVHDGESEMSRPEFDAMLTRAEAAIAKATGAA